MKNIAGKLASVLLVVLAICLASCGGAEVADELWKNATYSEDTSLGTGVTTVEVEVKAGEKSVTFTLKTDRKILGDALSDHGLIAGEESQYGLFVKTVNGISADYDVDGYYWGFYKNGEYMMTGVDGAEISDGEHYELVRTR